MATITIHGEGIAKRIEGLPLAACPTCKSTEPNCKRPSGHKAMTWHLSREDAQARLCRCATCLDWLRSRGLEVTS